jgi:hypothetical protein
MGNTNGPTYFGVQNNLNRSALIVTQTQNRLRTRAVHLVKGTSSGMMYFQRSHNMFCVFGRFGPFWD